MRFLTSLSLTALILILARTAGAVPVVVGHTNVARCDPLVVPQFVDELGIRGVAGSGFPGFPPDEEIDAVSFQTTLSSCPSAELPFFVNFVVRMTNLTPFDFDEVWYVADTETFVSNSDGEASTLLSGTIAGLAFRIDTVGINKPLVGEFGGILPGIFESGETWEFIIQDYTNGPGLPPEFFLSPGLVGFDSVLLEPVPTSSGSIIAVRAPEPAPLLLVGLGLASLAFVRRRAVPGR